jgi:hypothetical protein
MKHIDTVCSRIQNFSMLKRVVYIYIYIYVYIYLVDTGLSMVNASNMIILCMPVWIFCEP